MELYIIHGTLYRPWNFISSMELHIIHGTLYHPWNFISSMELWNDNCVENICSILVVFTTWSDIELTITTQNNWFRTNKLLVLEGFDFNCAEMKKRRKKNLFDKLQPCCTIKKCSSKLKQIIFFVDTACLKVSQVSETWN